MGLDALRMRNPPTHPVLGAPVFLCEVQGLEQAWMRLAWETSELLGSQLRQGVALSVQGQRDVQADCICWFKAQES